MKKNKKKVIKIKKQINFFKKIIFLIVKVSLFFLFFLIIFFLHYNLRLSERFGDEIAHLYGGHLILNGKIIYKDIQFNHQPIPYLISAITEKITQPKNLYLYIARQREAILFYSLFWNLIIFLIFGKVSLLFIVTFEFIKFHFQGYKNLQETLAVYPFVFALFDLIFLYFTQKDTLLRKILFSISVFTAGFSLLPLWLPVFFITFLRLLKTKEQKIFLFYPFLILLILMGTIVPYDHLIRETFIYNLKYFLPNNGDKLDLYKIIFLPFGIFFPPYNLIKLIITFLLISIILYIYNFYKIKKFFYFSIFLFIILYSTNFFRVDDFEFNSFHLLPWIATLIVIEIGFTFFSTKVKKKSSYIKYILVIIILLTNIVKNENFLHKKNFQNEFYINYSYSESYGRIISILKKDNNRLLVIPNDPLIYLTARILPSTRVIEYYPWVYYIPEVKNELITMIKKYPPEFIVKTESLNVNNSLEKEILFKLTNDYINLKHLNKPSNLFIIKSRIRTISPIQKKQVEDLLFSF